MPEPDAPVIAVEDRLPRAPHTIDELGIPILMVHDLVLRTALIAGRTSTLELSRKLALGPGLVTMVVEELRELRYLEVQGLDGRDYQLALTEAGRNQAQDRMNLCRYTGPAPVSLADYCATVLSQHAEPEIDLEALERAFSDLVISESLLLELGPAAIAGGAMFLYGPPGTGKSSIAERLLRIHHDHVLVPHTVEVDGQIVSVYDPIAHQAVAEQPHGLDPRWVLCERPCIIVGGELVGSMLDLAFQHNSGVYLAPVQMQANNGILVIDDFGRQTLTPEQLLNRWIVPLDRQVDYLALDYGLKFEVPFDAKIVFSTNLEPASLGDEAFFRRIQSKILIPTIEDDQFDEVLRRVTRSLGVTVTEGAPAHLREVSRSRGDGDLRPYLPAAVCKILLSIARFQKIEPVLDEAMIDRVAGIYFTHQSAMRGDPVASRAITLAPPPEPPAPTDWSFTDDLASRAVTVAVPDLPPGPWPASMEPAPDARPPVTAGRPDESLHLHLVGVGSRVGLSEGVAGRTAF